MVKKFLLKMKQLITTHRLQALLLVLAFVLVINFITFSVVLHIKKSKNTILYQNTTKVLTITHTKAQTQNNDEEKKEEKPLVIKKAPKNDKEDPKRSTDSSTSNTQKFNVEQSKSLYEVPGRSLGIDVSSWQSSINWKKVKADGIDFAIIRCGYRGYVYGNIVMDYKFEEYIKGALNAGIKVGVYFASSAINESEAKEEARWVAQVIKKYPITYPVAFDFERFDQGRLSGLSNTQLTNIANAFLKQVKASGYTPMMYASKNRFYDRWQVNRLTNCKYWLAHYTKNAKPSDYTGSYQMWQYTSSGQVNGIPGNVDMNIAYFKYSTEAPAKEPEVEDPKDEEQNPTTTPEKPKDELTFNSVNKKMVTNKATNYYLNYNESISGNIEINKEFNITGISSDNIWAKTTLDEKTIYMKLADLSDFTEETSALVTQ